MLLVIGIGFCLIGCKDKEAIEEMVLSCKAISIEKNTEFKLEDYCTFPEEVEVAYEDVDTSVAGKQVVEVTLTSGELENVYEVVVDVLLPKEESCGEYQKYNPVTDMCECIDGYIESEEGCVFPTPEPTPTPTPKPTPTPTPKPKPTPTAETPKYTYKCWDGSWAYDASGCPAVPQQQAVQQPAPAPQPQIAHGSESFSFYTYGPDGAYNACAARLNQIGYGTCSPNGAGDAYVLSY